MRATGLLFVRAGGGASRSRRGGSPVSKYKTDSRLNLFSLSATLKLGFTGVHDYSKRLCETWGYQFSPLLTKKYSFVNYYKTALYSILWGSVRLRRDNRGPSVVETPWAYFVY